MNRIYFLLIIVFLSSAMKAQLDTIFMTDGIAAVEIKEVLPDAVKFSYPSEEHLTTVYKNVIRKIKYKSGREETFAEALSLKAVTGGRDWQNVAIANVESEVKGLFKIDDVSSKAKGLTTLSNMDRVKDRSYKKLKIEAALLGANIIYLTNERIQGNVFGTEYQAGNSTETNLSGIAYSNMKPNFNNFKELLTKKNLFRISQKQWLGRNSLDLEISTEKMPSVTVLTNPTEENGFIYVNSSISTESANKFRVIYFDESKIVLMYRKKGKIFNIILDRN